MIQGLRKPRIVAFEVTDRCVLKCRHCRAAAMETGVDPLDTQDCKSVLKGLAEYNKCVIIFTGGEPMMRDDLIELVAYSRSVGLRPVMATCGYHLNEDFLKQLREAGLLSISFSLDGKDAATHDVFRQVPGAFDMTLKAVSLVRDMGMRFQFNTTLTTLNVSQIDSIAALAVEQGADCWNPFILVPVGRGDEIRDLLLSPAEYEAVLENLSVMRTNLPIELRLTCGPQFARVTRQQKAPDAERVPGCLAATGFAFISHRGDIQTCGFLEITAGNLVENGFDFGAIWESSDLLNSLRDPASYKGGCGACGYVQTCRGCRARAKAMTGDYLAADPICKIAQAFDRKMEDGQ
ncbi:MAG: radical SAM protein [Planctomycetota bacterium]|jgi:radical SAM protein with 4Fe4S-binding SPASM domain